MKGRWLTVLKAQWSPNPDVYPHFTVSLLVFFFEFLSAQSAPGWKHAALA